VTQLGIIVSVIEYVQAPKTVARHLTKGVIVETMVLGIPGSGIVRGLVGAATAEARAKHKINKKIKNLNLQTGSIASHGRWEEGDNEHAKKAAGLRKVVVVYQWNDNGTIRTQKVTCAMDDSRFEKAKEKVENNDVGHLKQYKQKGIYKKGGVEILPDEEQ